MFCQISTRADEAKEDKGSPVSTQPQGCRRVLLQPYESNDNVSLQGRMEELGRTLRPRTMCVSPFCLILVCVRVCFYIIRF